MFWKGDFVKVCGVVMTREEARERRWIMINRIIGRI